MVYWNYQEYVERRTYGNLERAWIGFKISKKEVNRDKMKHYAEGIQKFERQLRLPVSNFSDVFKEENDLNSTKQKEEGSAVTNEP